MKEGRRWEKRYFELEKGSIHCYKTKGKDNRGTLALAGLPVSMDADNPRVITIETKDSTWNLRAPSKQEAEVWLQAIKLHASIF